MSKSSNRGQRWQLWGLTLLALAALPLALLYTEQAISNQPQPAQQVERVTLPRVTVSKVHSGRYRSQIEVYAEVKAVDEISLGSQIAGRVQWRSPNLVPGGRVAKGEELIRLDPTDYQAALANAKQSLAEAELALQQELRQRNQAERDWQRSGLQEKPSALVLREPQLAVARARHAAAEVALQQAKRDLRQTRLKAPFGAVVLERQVSRGSYLDVAGPVASLRASEQAEITVSLSAEQWLQLPVNPIGQPVQLSSREQSGVQWQGRISRLAANVDPNTRLRQLVVTVDQPLQQQPPLLFGSFVSVRIEGPERADLLALPASALTADGYIWWVEQQRLQRRKVSPQFSHNGQVFIANRDFPHPLPLVRKPMTSYLAGTQVQAVEQAVVEELAQSAEAATAKQGQQRAPLDAAQKLVSIDGGEA